MKIKLLITATFLSLSNSVWSESLQVENNFVRKEIMDQKVLTHQLSPLVRNRINSVTPDIINPTVTSAPRLSNKNELANNCLADAGSGGCSQMLISSSGDVENYSIDYGMFSVIGSGIRLPDEQLESVDGIEDEGFFE